MVNLSETISKIKPFKALVIGDLVLDTYTVGSAKRISPEAPVAVVNVHHCEHRPGMSGNVALNLLALGADVTLVGRVGSDQSGETLLQALSDEGLSTDTIFNQDNYSTPVKNRIIADHQQVVRVDHETIESLPELLEEEIVDRLQSIIASVDVVAISDYAKGFLTRSLLSSLIELAKEKQIPIVIDPKGVDFSKYSGATIVKPNFSEALLASGLERDAPLSDIAESVIQEANCEMLMITRSESGASLFFKDGSSKNFSVRVRDVIDVTGAGDTVLASLTAILANDISLDMGIPLCNAAAGIAIERFGCARVTLSDIAKSILQHDSKNKVYDEEHMYALQQVILGKKVTVLGIHIEGGLTPEMYRSICEISKEEGELLLFIRDHHPSEEILALLSALHFIDYIVINHENLRVLCEQIHPSHFYIFDQNQLKSVESSTILSN